MKYPAIKPDQRDGPGANLFGVADAFDQIGRETGPAVHGDGQDRIVLRQQSLHQVDEHLFALGVIGPSRVKRDVIGETTDIERSLAGGNDVFGEVTGEMLGSGGGPAISHQVNPPLAVVAVYQNLLCFDNGGRIQLFQ